MRRRRQKNNLLGKIVGISILVHIVLLPILAHFGAFKKIQQHFMETKMVVLPPPPSPPDRAAHQAQHVEHHAAVARGHAAHAAAGGHHSNLNTPHVAVAEGSAGDSGSAIEQGSGAQGALPTPKGTGAGSGTGSGAGNGTGGQTVSPAKTDNPPAQPRARPAVADTRPPVQSVAPDPVKPSPPAPHDPVITRAEPLDAQMPKPTIPDDLLSDSLDKTFVAEFTVSPEGVPVTVRVAQSTGNDELDRRAIDAARRWRFKPATRDGQPIESRVRLSIEFQVS